MDHGSLRHSGSVGYDWSRVATVYGAGTWDARAYGLYFNASGVDPSVNYVRWYGFPVRCLVILVLVCVGELEPLYFVRSGSVDLNNGSLGRFGSYGHGWSHIATAYGTGTWDTRAYYLYFITSDVNSSGNYVRWVGLPVRCLV